MKKQLVFITNNLAVGGAERMLLGLIPHIQGPDVDVSIVTAWGSGDLAPAFMSLGVPIYWAAGRLRYDGGNLLLKLYFTALAPVTFMRLVWTIRRLNPDAVMTCLAQSDILGVPAAYLSRVPRRVVCQTDTQPLSPMIRWLKQNLAIAQSTHIIANSHATQRFVAEHFQAPANQITVIPNGINTGHFIRSASAPHQPPVVGFLGRLETIKNPQGLIMAISRLQRQFGLSPTVEIHGDGSLRSQLEGYVDQQGLHNVKFFGAASDPAAVLGRVDILVVPSLSEGFGLVALEGLMSGRVVVASDLPAIRDLITHQQNGLLFSADRPDELAGQLADLLSMPEYTHRLRQAAVSWSRQHVQAYDISTVARQYKLALLT